MEEFISTQRVTDIDCFSHGATSMRVVTRENLTKSLLANNKGAEEPAHVRSLISTLVIHLLESIMSNIASGKISIF